MRRRGFLGAIGPAMRWLAITAGRHKTRGVHDIASVCLSPQFLNWRTFVPAAEEGRTSKGWFYRWSDNLTSHFRPLARTLSRVSEFVS